MSDYPSSSATLDRPVKDSWDYNVKSIHARHNELLEDQLREYGRDGWELVFVNMPVQCEYQCIFRRPLAQ
jgi:hypothetical protein